jgi:hypothetical protein
MYYYGYGSKLKRYGFRLQVCIFPKPLSGDTFNQQQETDLIHSYSSWNAQFARSVFRPFLAPYRRRFAGYSGQYV